jgi:hypothetical protein
MALFLEFQQRAQRVVAELRVVLRAHINAGAIFEIDHVERLGLRVIDRGVVRAVRPGIHLGEIKPVFDVQLALGVEQAEYVIDVDPHVVEHFIVVALRGFPIPF